MLTERKIVSLEDYRKFADKEQIERIQAKADRLRGIRVVNINSTLYGGGVAELLGSLILLLNSVGIRTGWRVIQGSPDFFSITKKMHNALQSGRINLSQRKKRIYERVVYENSVRNHLDHDFVVVHDPQPLPLIEHYKKRGPWIWRCHIDLSNPNPELWDYLSPFVEKYDAVILSIREYMRNIRPPQFFFMPAIDPFSIKNRELSDKEIQNRLEHYGIPTDLPLVVQISRFDKWKDPRGVIRAFKRARREVDATLVLLGNIAADDPEGVEVYNSLLAECDDRILLISHEDTALVNALQRRAAVVLQKSIREGFGLTVAEAMWKETPVIGGKVGGIRYQIEDGDNGFLVSSAEEAAARMVQLLKDEDLRRDMGRRARQKVRKEFLMLRLMEQYLDLFDGFETIYRHKSRAYNEKVV